MAKLNYDRDVKGLVVKLKKLYDGKVELKSKVDKYVLIIDDETVSDGTLREAYCYILGMLKVLEG